MTGHASDLHEYLQILAGDQPAGRLIEIRSATAHGGMRQTFTPATRTDLAARTITTLATSTDVYVGVLLRHRPAGGRHACDRSHLAFIEIDRPDRRYHLAELTAGLPAPPHRSQPGAGPRRAATGVLDQQLLVIPAATYVEALTGLRPNRAGKVCCPFHELSVGRAVAAGVLPACSLVDASLTDHGRAR